MGKRLPVWSCAQTGDCCRNAVALVMTYEEAAIVKDAAPPDVALWWTPGPRPEQVALMPTEGKACPLLGADNKCRIYEARPTNCRRFKCYREPGEVLEPGGPLGCTNAERRVLTDRTYRRDYALHQRRVMRDWGLRHGWQEGWQ